MPAAVLAGGASRRIGRPKAALPYGTSTLLAHQTSRLAPCFERVFAVVKEPPDYATGPARLLFDGQEEHAAIHGLARILEEVSDRVFVLAVDLPVLPLAAIQAIAAASLASDAAVVLPRAEGRLQPLAAVWRRRALPALRQRLAQDDRSLRALAEELGATVVPEEDLAAADPSGNGFTNVNTIHDYLALREWA